MLSEILPLGKTRIFFYLFSFIKFDKFYDTSLSPLHFPVNQIAQQTAQHYRFAPLKTQASGMIKRGEERTVVTRHVARRLAEALTVSSL